MYIYIFFSILKKYILNTVSGDFSDNIFFDTEFSETDFPTTTFFDYYIFRKSNFPTDKFSKKLIDILNINICNALYQDSPQIKYADL